MERSSMSRPVDPPVEEKDRSALEEDDRPRSSLHSELQPTPLPSSVPSNSSNKVVVSVAREAGSNVDDGDVRQSQTRAVQPPGEAMNQVQRSSSIYCSRPDLLENNNHTSMSSPLSSPSSSAGSSLLVDMIKTAIHNSAEKTPRSSFSLDDGDVALARNSSYHNNNHKAAVLDNRTVADEEHGVNPNDILDLDTDPFSVREGCNLTWQNVNMTLPATQKDGAARKLLENVWGEVPKKETTAILGASGAGKTSLLNILAGRLQSKGQKLRIEADVRLNNYRVDPTDIRVRQSIAFVAQDDSLPTTSTPREAIRFSAKMRLPRTATDAQLDALTSRMLVELGLDSCADTLIGGTLIKGISGGERKRTSVGVELVVRPTMVFLDEPTSGLDSFSAEQCCEVLKKVANAGASVLFTIHQPASEVFATFDHLIFLNKGRVMYQGSVKAIPEFFGARGFPVPYNYNPADWIIDVAQGIPVQELDEVGFFPSDLRELGESRVPVKGQDMLGRPVQRGWAGLEEPPPGTQTQIGMLFRRELLHIRRDWTVSFGRVFLVGFLSLFVGLIFFDVGSADKGDRMTVTSQFGAMITVLITAMMSTSQIALFSFPDERPVFLREYSTNHYSVLSYFVAHLTTEFMVTAVQIFILVIIIYYMADFSGDILTYFLSTYALAMATTAQAVFGSCLAGSNTKLAMQLLPLLFTPQMLFSGFFVAPDLIPVWLKWAPYVCAMTYSTRIVVVEEFENCSDDPAELVNCNDLLQSTNSEPDEVWWYWIALIMLFAVFRVAALFVLQRSALKFY